MRCVTETFAGSLGDLAAPLGLVTMMTAISACSADIPGQIPES
jgi:hypothetical protein